MADPLWSPHASVKLSCHPSGEASALIETRGSTDTVRWRSIHSLRLLLLQNPFRGFVDLISSYEHLLVTFDCGVTDYDEVYRTLYEMLRGASLLADDIKGRMFTIPIVFGGDFGPDLAEVARILETTESALVDFYTSEEFVVRFLGAAMEPMCSGEALATSVPRRTTPRTRVPAGSLAVAAQSLTIYPFESPGGWQLLGRTPLLVCDISQAQPTAYQPGDLFRFEAISEFEWGKADRVRLEPNHG